MPGVKVQRPTKDYNHVSDKPYVEYRKQADLHYGKRQSLSAQSQKAYKSGDKAKAKQLSDAAKQEAAQGDQWNEKAAEYVFVENNRDSDENDIDLHGLYVREAEYILKVRIINGVQRGQSSLDCIVGKGLHSANGVAKLKPAVEQLCQQAGLKCQVDPKNAGVLMINLRGAQIPASWQGINPNGVGAMQANANVPDTRINHGNQFNNQNQVPQYMSTGQQGGYQQGYQGQQQYPGQQQQYYQQQQGNNGNDNNACNIVIQLLKMCFS